MDKIFAIKELSGGNITKAAAILHITRQTLHAWPDKLEEYQENMVLGALVKLGRRKIREKINYDK